MFIETGYSDQIDERRPIHTDMGQAFHANETSLLDKVSVKQGIIDTKLKMLELLASLVNYVVSGDLKGACVGNSVSHEGYHQCWTTS